MKKFLTLCALGAGIVWAYFWYVRGENLFLRGTPTSVAPAYAFAERISPKMQSKWETGAPMPTLRSGLGAAAIGDVVYAVGGFDGYGRSLATVEAFNVRRNEWMTLAPLPKPVHSPAVGSDGERLYVFGGLEGIANTPVDGTWIFDPRSGAWAEGPAIPALVGASAAVFADGKFHVIGGLGLGRSTQGHYIFDPKKSEWSLGDPLISGRDHLAAAALSGKIYAIGGLEGSLLYAIGDTDVYHVGSDTWEVRESLPVRRGKLCAVTSGGKIHAIGGANSSGAYADVYEYDERADRWRVDVLMPTARQGFGCAMTAGRIVTVGGGRRAGFSVSDVTEIFTPAP